MGAQTLSKHNGERESGLSALSHAGVLLTLSHGEPQELCLGGADVYKWAEMLGLTQPGLASCLPCQLCARLLSGEKLHSKAVDSTLSPTLQGPGGCSVLAAEGPHTHFPVLVGEVECWGWVGPTAASE